MSGGIPDRDHEGALAVERGGGDVVALRRATGAWFAISWQTFGGPAGQIAVMQHELVEKRRWIGQQRFLHALSYCMLLPGPEAQQLAIYTGWLLNGVRGGLIAGSLFVLPGLLALLALSAVYVGFGETTLVTGLFAGLAPAVIAIVVGAVHRVASRALTHPALIGIAVAAFLALALFAVRFPVVVLAAGGCGWVLSRWVPALGRPAARPSADGPAPLVSDDFLHHALPSPRRSLLILAIGLTLWFAPVAVAAAVAGSTPVLVQQGLFFSGAAVVTFGGAYAVLAYVAQQAVQVYGWLGPRVEGARVAVGADERHELHHHDQRPGRGLGQRETADHLTGAPEKNRPCCTSTGVEPRQEGRDGDPDQSWVGQGAGGDPVHGADDDRDHGRVQPANSPVVSAVSPKATYTADRASRASTPGSTNRDPAISPPQAPFSSHPV